MDLDVNLFLQNPMRFQLPLPSKKYPFFCSYPKLSALVSEEFYHCSSFLTLIFMLWLWHHSRGHLYDILHADIAFSDTLALVPALSGCSTNYLCVLLMASQ